MAFSKEKDVEEHLKERLKASAESVTGKAEWESWAQY